MTKKRFINCVLFVFLTFTTFVSCNHKIQPDLKANEREKLLHQNAQKIHVYAKEVKEQRLKAYEEYLSSFTLEEKICQLFIQSLGGNKTFVPEEKLSTGETLIPGGYLFFGFNLAPSAKEIIEFTNSINNYCVENNCSQPFLAIDHEGGPVNRLKKINAPLPSCEDLAKEFSVEDAKNIYSLQAKQLKNLGFHVNLAPVLEVLTNDNKSFLDGRSFGTADQVLAYGTECVTAYEDNGIATVVKHFPGNTNTDPHSGLPVIKLTKNEIDETLIPFKTILQNTKPKAILMSHAIVNQVDKGVPSCLSKIWVTDILRNEYGYEGIIFSDDIFMAALAKNGYDTKKAVVMAIEAGIDCIMISGRTINYPVSVLMEKAQSDEAFNKRIQESFQRIINFKIENGLIQYVPQKDGSYKIQSVQNQLKTEELYNQFLDSKNTNNSFYK